MYCVTGTPTQQPVGGIVGRLGLHGVKAGEPGAAGEGITVEHTEHTECLAPTFPGTDFSYDFSAPTFPECLAPFFT